MRKENCGKVVARILTWLARLTSLTDFLGTESITSMLSGARVYPVYRLNSLGSNRDAKGNAAARTIRAPRHHPRVQRHSGEKFFFARLKDNRSSRLIFIKCEFLNLFRQPSPVPQRFASTSCPLDP